MRASWMLLLLSTTAAAQSVPFVVLRDDSLVPAITDGGVLRNTTDALVQQYLDAGQTLPDVLSMWTTYPMGGSPIQTLFVPYGNDVRGIGLETVYGVPEVFATMPPLRAVLLHNDVTQLPARAARHHAPLAGYGRYLFLLELSHTWGPAMQIPGTAPGALIGFPFHWSFWVDAGGSPAGGNTWTDNADGSFTVVTADPATVRWSMLDLYGMGLATPDEVPPFGVLTSPVVPTGAMDPLSGGAVREVTFPWMEASAPLTVQATRQAITIDDIIATNGARMPAAADSPRAFTLGIVLIVPAGTSDADVMRLGTDFEPFASSLAPAFHDASRERADMTVVSQSTLPVLPDAGPPIPDAGPPVDGGTIAMPAGGCGCRVGGATPAPLALFALLFAAMLRRRA